MKNFRVEFTFTCEGREPILCDCIVEADSFFTAQFEAMKVMADTLELCSVSEIESPEVHS